MTRVRIIILVLVGVLVGLLIAPTSAGAASLLKVMVSNTSENPVPVTGSVGVSGPVSIDEPVTVDGNVGIVDNREPFETRVDLPLGAGQPFDSFSFQVPEGKRLVVEFIAARVALPSGQTPLLSANASNGGLGFPIPLENQGVGNGNAFYTGAMDVLDFGASGSYVFGIERQNPAGGPLSGTSSGFVYVSGYLVPAGS